MALRSPESLFIDRGDSQKGVLDGIREGLQFIVGRIPLFALVFLIGAGLWDKATNFFSGVVGHTRAAVDEAGIPDWVRGIDSNDVE